MEQIQELITRVINGDTQAFEEIYQATYRQGIIRRSAF